MDTNADPNGVDTNALEELARLDAALGRKVRWLRRNHEMSQADLAKKAGIGERTLHRIESGERGMTIKQLGLLCSALGVKPGQFVADVEKELGATAGQKDGVD